MKLSDSIILNIVDNAVLPCIELEDKGNGILETDQNILLEDNEDYHLLFDVCVNQHFKYNRANYFTESSITTGQPHIEIYNINVLPEYGDVKLTKQQVITITNRLKQKIMNEL